MLDYINRLAEEHSLPASGYRDLLICRDSAILESLHQKAQEVAFAHFGNKIFIRGLIEVSNCCRNNCYYCGIRKGNVHIERYRLDKETILHCCRLGHELGFRTFVMQGGEDPAQTIDWLEDVISEIRGSYPDCAITLSLGEKSRNEYQRLFDAGANRYLLRHETYNKAHYCSMHPAEMSQVHRLQCISELKEIGFQTGTGMMIGSPGQTVDCLVEDLLYIEKLQPQMIGIGPFIPHHDTPFRAYEAGSVELTLTILSILRLMNPHVLLPATTALATLSDCGHQRGILAGANVVMPNLSPVNERSKYNLYDNKASLGAEAAEGLSLLRKQMQAIGYVVATDRGDYK